MEESSISQREIILAGSGGQGLIVAGIMLGEAALLEGKNALQTQSYGIASRGGFSMAEVIISREEIVFQQVQRPDAVLALTAEALDKLFPRVGPGIPVFYDTDLVVKTPPGAANLIGHPFTRLAGELGQGSVVNMIALGALLKATGIVNPESLFLLIRKRFSGKTADINCQAIETGLGLPSAACASGAVRW